MPIVLRASTTRSFIPSAVIRWRCDFPISHIEFQREDGSTLGARADGLGVAERPASENRQQRDVIIATFDGIEHAHDWVMANRLGWKYDYKGIFGIACGREDWHAARARECASVVLEGAEEGAHNFLFNRDMAVWQVTPRDIMVSPRVSILSAPAYLLAPQRWPVPTGSVHAAAS